MWSGRLGCLGLSRQVLTNYIIVVVVVILVFFRVCIERGEWILCCPWEQRSLMCGACALKLLVCISFQVLHHYLDFSRVSSSCPLAALLLSHSIVSFVFVFLLVCMWQTGREPRVCWGFCSCCFPLRQWRSLSATSLPHRSFLSTMVTWRLRWDISKIMSWFVTLVKCTCR